MEASSSPAFDARARGDVLADLDRESCYRVLQARDARFDGRIFVGVKTTGIYCRPICPARTPKIANVEFFGTAAAAQEAGFRPCLRCRPEVAPDLAAWKGSSSTVLRALRLIDHGPLEDASIDTLADRLGIGARQLRRLFAQHIGASPKTIVQTRRVHLAKQLIQETTMPVTEVAYASGFGSIRRFNETFKEMFGRPPTELRRPRAATTPGGGTRELTLRLAYAVPHAWSEMLAWLAARAIADVERIAGETYSRSFSVDGHTGLISLTPGRRGELILRAYGARVDALPVIINRVRRMCDLAADPAAIDSHLAMDPLLAPLIAARPGLRIAGAWTGFELAVRAFLEGRETPEDARRTLAQLTVARGRPLDDDLRTLVPGVTHVFPDSSGLRDADLTPHGVSDVDAAAVQSLARAIDAEPGILQQGRSLDASLRALESLPHTDARLAHVIAMRELHEPDAFPASDPLLLQVIASLLHRPISAAQLFALAERWRPWRAYAAAHLWAHQHAISRRERTARTAIGAVTQVA